MTLPQLSNPFSTGAGGTTFEQLVGTYYLVVLLAEDIPRGLNQGITTALRFQQSYTGTLLDDIRVVSETADRQRFKLDLQVKHDLVIGDKVSLIPPGLERCMGNLYQCAGRAIRSRR
jgi:hypothetical protein